MLYGGCVFKIKHEEKQQGSIYAFAASDGIYLASHRFTRLLVTNTPLPSLSGFLGPSQYHFFSLDTIVIYQF